MVVDREKCSVFFSKCCIQSSHIQFVNYRGKAMKYIFAIIFTLLISSNVFAGTTFEGWGKTPKEAMNDALHTAITKSGGGCLCKGWNMDMKRDCVEGLGGYICKACGSNHKGSCKKGSDVDILFNDLKKIKGLFE